MIRERLTTEEFIKRAKKIHGDKYDYSKVDYKGVKHKVCIICPIHGEFWQIPTSHLRGMGCNKCSGFYLNTELFIEKAKSVHGDKYDYSKVDYVNASTKICIICNKHGEFWQLPSNHLSGQGCRKCQYENKKSLVYGVGLNDVDYVFETKFYKIWRNMLERCYSNEYKNKYPTYKKASVCEEWKILSNFKRWFDKNYVEGWHLDKDILVEGNKVYSPETCCFVPNEINVMFESYLNKTETGITKNKDGYRVKICINKEQINLGLYEREEDAIFAYRKAKKERIIDVANKFKDKLNKKVYQAIINYL